MSTAVRPHPGTGASNEQATDMLVVFGISGDLARVMTFRSLYRLERRGLLRCPILGVAADDWSDDELRAHARAAIEATGEPIDEEVFTRFAARLSYLSKTAVEFSREILERNGGPRQPPPGVPAKLNAPSGTKPNGIAARSRALSDA